jgi:DNA-binding response OmpR family regulator
MIFVVDDDPEAGGPAVEALRAAGLEAQFFPRAQEALAHAAEEEPVLILSDVVMPEMNGFAFKAGYAARFPSRTTPFVFLSGLADADSVVRGLDQGADDYLTKPVDPKVLAAKVRAILNRRKRWTVPVFRGDLKRLPFMKLLQFCELKGITGQLEISAETLCTTLPLKAGRLVLEGMEDTLLEQLYDLAAGVFIIHAQPVDYREIEAMALAESAPAGTPAADTAVAAPPAAAAAPVPPPDKQELPMGRLSGVRVDERLFQLQTEYVQHPVPQVVTIVIYAGRVMLKRKVDIPPEKRARTAVEAVIEELHTGTEQELRNKIAELAKKKPEEQESPKDAYSRLFEQGFELYREGKYRESLEAWEEAYRINPTDRILETNLAVLRKKLKIPS